MRASAITSPHSPAWRAPTRGLRRPVHMRRMWTSSLQGARQQVGKYGTGQAIRRVEDQRFITGTGRYTDDISFPGQTSLYFFRSPYAHGLIRSLDVAAARAAPGVIAVYTSEDLDAAGV